MNSHINNNTTTPNYLRILQTLPTYINGNFTYLNNNYAYIIFNSNGSILFKEDTPCELLIVGAGGRGGNFSIFGGAGGGGSGEIIYNPSFTISSNSYDIIVGVDSTDSNQRISKIIANNQIIISANGGGDGAYWDGSSLGEIQRFPPQTFTSNSPIIKTTFLNRICYKSTIYINSNSYDVFYSSRKINTSFDAINLFNCYEPSNNIEAAFLEEQYNNKGSVFTYTKSDYLIDFRYKGDWICIKLPIPILLTSYSFFQNITEITGAPNNFKIYGSINGIDWDTVKDRNLTGILSYSNYKYTENLSPLPTKPYLYYALVVNSLVGNLGYLNFNEWELKGRPIIITPATINGGSSMFNLPSNQIQGGFGGSYSNQNLIKIINNNTTINIPYDNHFFKINRSPLNTYLNSGTYSAIFNEGFITFGNETYLSFPILTSIEPEYWYKFNSGINDNIIITGNITTNLNDIYFNYGTYLTPSINNLWNSNGISFSFWIKPEIEIGTNLWIFKTIENSNEFISFHKNEFKISNNNVLTSVTFNINLLDGLYHHFVCSINPSGRIYVACDGIIYENYSLNPFINKSYKNGKIGEFFQGYMKDFRIYLKVLDINEIQELFKGRIEIFYNRFNENITTTNIQLGSGGIGGTSSSIPTIKNFYGDGGDGNRNGNLGLGVQGIVIIKYPYPYFKTTITSYKFPNSQFLKFSGLNNSNGIPFKLLTNNDNNRILSINDLNFHISSNDPYIQSTSNIDINNTLFVNSNGNVGFGTNIGVYNSLSINDFTIENSNSNISFINPDGFIGIGTTNPLNFLDIRNDTCISKLNINSLIINLINTNQNSLFIPKNSIIKFNYINDTKINSGTYNINFTNGSIIFGSLNSDKSYPILKDIYSSERQYPPKLYDSFTTEIISSGEIFNINPLNYYKETITLNKNNISYGSGIYEIYSSGTTNDIARTRIKLFNYVDINISDPGAYWGYNNYNKNSGLQLNNKFIKNNYYGEWFIIKFPNPIILTKYHIYAGPYSVDRWPTQWRFYGSIDGINWNDILEAEVNTPLTASSYVSNKYEKILNKSFNIPYLYIGIVFNKITGISGQGGNTHLAVNEIRLFGKEIEENIINPIIWYKFDNSSSQMLLDSSGNNYNLTNNGATFDTTTFIKGNGSVNLNHSLSEYLSIPSINLFNIQSINGISFCLWFRMNTIDTGEWSRIFDFNNGNTVTPRWILISRYINFNTLNFDIYNGNIQISRITTNNYIDNNWHHIVWSINNIGKWEIYIDGIIASFTEILPTNVNIENIIFTNNSFGKSLYSLNGYYNGNLDDFRIYNFVLTSNQVHELYKGRIEIYTYQDTNSNLNIYGNALISGNADIKNLILNGVIYKNNGIPYIDSGWTTMLDQKSDIFNSYSVVGIGTTFPRFQNRLDVNGSIICNEVYVNGALLTNDYIKNSGTSAESISFGTLKISSGGTGVNSFTSNQILNSDMFWSNNSLNILGNLNNSNNSNGKIVLNNGIRIGNIIIDNYGISNGNSNSNIIIGNKLFISSNIGIGTTNPINSLDIHGNIVIRRNLQVNNINNIGNLNGIIMNVNNISIENSGIINRYLSRWGNSNNFMGFVGIGTTNPQNSLDIIGNVGIKGILNVSNINNNIFNSTFINTSNINIENSVINYKNNNNFIGSRWILNNNSIFYNSGSVGINTNIFNNKLNTNGNFSMNGILNMNNYNISNIDWFRGKTLNISNLRFLTNSSSNINFISGNTLNLNNWTTYNTNNTTKIFQIFTYTGTIQTFNVPNEVSSINIYCWGAGGGSSSYFSTILGGFGGNGGFVSATLNLTSISSLKIIVGQGGKKGVKSGDSTRSFGGGGNGKAIDNYWALGGGGGLSGVFIDNENITVDANGIININAIPILIAGGGGGAGAFTGYHGGNAGGTTGNTGNTGGTPAPTPGAGGTQTEGGSGAEVGIKYKGGNGIEYGAGGGGGWFGGGSGKWVSGNVASGGGGSSYLNTSGYTLTNTYIPNAQSNGTRTAPENTNLYYQSGIALGSDVGLKDGGNGLVIIEYNIFNKNTFYNYGNVGIRTTSNQLNTLDINGDLNFTNNISNFNIPIFNFENCNLTSLISISSTPVINITNNSINNSYGYYQINNLRNITFNRDLLCDVLVVGAGGNGGSGSFSGGGGAGEVIYQPNYIFERGIYQLSVGSSTNEINNRISKITKGTTEIFKALGGGDGNVFTNSFMITGTSNSINIVADNYNYSYAEFKTSGTLTINENINCDILIVGGGGGGGNGVAWSAEAGGGGAGGVVYMVNKTLNKGTYNIIVGDGGSANTNGNDSIIRDSNNTTLIFDNISLIGKGGGKGASGSGNIGGSGGSGGGGCHSTTNGGSGTQGNTVWNGSSYVAGGYNGAKPTFGSAGGGGGGATQVGNIDGQGHGGNGILINITGLNTYYAGGGNAYPNTSSKRSNGGGGLQNSSAIYSSALENTGSGGSGGYQFNQNHQNGGKGGSGIVIIRYLNRYYYDNSYPILKNINPILWYKLNNSLNDMLYTSNNLINSTIYDINFYNGNISFGESPYVRPWGAYFANDWSGTTLPDSSGNNRHATTSSGNITKTTGNGNGISSSITYISGGTSSTISWPSGSIPTKFTILSLTRYNGTTKRRILVSNGTGNWLHGHYDGKRGHCHYDTGFNSSYTTNPDNWVCVIGKNNGIDPGNILVDGDKYGINIAGNGGYNLGVNNDMYGTTSDWALNCVIIYDTHLSDIHMSKLNDFINTYKSTGNLDELKSNIIGNIDKSYPLIKGEKQYPPKLYDSSTNETTNTDELTGIIPTTYYKGTFTINSYTNGYGIGTYVIYSSTYLNSDTEKKLLFNFNNTDGNAHWASSGTYSAQVGNYIGSSYIKFDYKGDWIIIKLPISIILNRFIFYIRSGLISRCPGLWKCYGSNDGVTFTEILEASNTEISLTSSSYSSGYYQHIFTTISIPYSYIGFTINKLVGGDDNAYILNFSEIQLFAKEDININPILWYKFDGSSTFLNDTYNTSNNLINNDTTYDTTNSIKGAGSLKFVASSSQYALLPNNFNWNSINAVNGITFSWWARNNNSTGSYGRLWDFGVKNTTNAAVGSRYIMVAKLGTSTNHRFEVTNTQENGSNPGNYVHDTSGTNYFDGIWRHYVWTISSTGIWNIYINNLKILDNSQKIAIASMTQANIINNFGRSLFTNDGYYDGNIDDFRIYDIVLTPSQVYDLYNGRVDYYQNPIDQTNKISINSNINSLTLINNSILNFNYNNPYNINLNNLRFDNINYVKDNGSIKFKNFSNNFSNNFPIIPNNFNWNDINRTNGISFSWWSRNNNSSNKGSPIFNFGIKSTRNTTVGSKYIIVSKNNVNDLMFGIANSEESNSGLTNLTSFTTSGINYFNNMWRHYVWTISTNGIWNIYINNSNILNNSSKIIIPSMTQSNIINNLGRSLFGTDEFFDGNLNDFRIYNQVLSTQDVQELYGNNIDNIVNNITGIGNIINTASDNSDYNYAFFASNGTFTINTNIICDILVVGGGGGGGNRHGSGGGAGALIYETNVLLINGTYTINIGAGGAGNLVTASNGEDTSITLSGNNIYLAKGGGGGIGSKTTTNGINGGSGSGGGGNSINTGGNAVNTNIANTISGLTFGYSGGSGKGNNEGGEYWSGGGGGGAGGAGFSSTIESSRIRGGNGGIGRQISITGTPIYYAGGGGGGLINTGYGRTTGGLGGGGDGGISDGVLGTGANGTPNTGGGAGGGGYNSTTNANGIGGTGGSGVVIIRYQNNKTYIKKISYSSGGSGGGSYYNSNNQSISLTKWNNIYSYVSSGNNGTTIRGGDGGSSLIKSTYNLTGTNQTIGIGGLGASSTSIPIGNKSFGCGGDGNGGVGGSGLIIIKIIKEINNFNLSRNYLFNNKSNDYVILKDNNGNIINPIAWYKFDNNFLTIDSSGNNKTLTNINTVSINTTDFIKGDGSAQFNGNNYFQIDEPSYFSPNSSFSISLWMKLTNINNNYKTIFSCRSATSGYNIYIVPTSYNMELWTPSDVSIWNETTILTNYFSRFTNIWKYFTITFNKRTSDYEIKFYLDGILINTIINNTYVSNTNTNLRIGSGTNETTAQYNLDNGSLLDDFRFYNLVLTANQVLELYENSRINFVINGNSFSKGTNYISSINEYPLLTYANSNIINPIIWYKFDDSTNIGRDEMNVLNLSNSTTPVTLNTTLFSKGVSACDITTTSFLKSTNTNISSYFSQKSFSISFWVYMRSSTNGFTIAIGPATSDGGLWFGYSVNNLLNTYHFGVHNTNGDLNSQAIYNSDINRWVYLTFTYNLNTTLRCIYRNGILIASNTRAAVSFTTNVFWIGRITNDTSYNMNGIIDDFRIYDFELSQSQVLELYNTTNNYPILINYPTNYFSSCSSNLHNPFIRTSNNDLEILSYTNNNINSILLQSNINFIINNDNKLIINSNIISINNSLDIRGNSGTITNQGGAYITTSSSAYLSGYMPEYTTFSLRTVDNIICGKNSYALSDKRIKTNISNIDDISSLEKILKIEPKIYGYIDNIHRTNSNVYGFLAQQIRDVLPEATELTTKFIPDIFKLTKINGNRINLNDEELQKIYIGDILEIYTKNNSYEVNVINKDNDGINININIIDNDIFIYGRQVKDFHIIDKSYLYTLNICATQELARIVEGLKERINNL